MKKVISFSLWGDNPKYTFGAIRNIELAKSIYPEWICRFYIADSVPIDFVEKLTNFTDVEIIHKSNEKPGWTNAFWRYSSSYDESVDISIFRDCDSRLNSREKYAVDEWLNSTKTFHIMRDHPYHKFHMLGGMWGYKKNDTYDMKKIFDMFSPTDSYWTEYEFFKTVLFPIIGDDKITHDDFFEKKPFPTKRDGQHFVGEVYDENDNRNPEHYSMI